MSLEGVAPPSRSGLFARIIAGVRRPLPIVPTEQAAAPRSTTPARCHTCPLGVAAGVREHGACPFSPRLREAGARLYVEGESADRVWYVVSGRVALSREEGGVTWAVRREGEMLGVEAVVSETYRDTAVTLTATTLCAVSRDALDRWLGPPMSPSRVVLELALRARCNESPRRSGADGSATRRVARWILDESPSEGEPPIPRKVMAGLLGMLPETLSRALARLREMGAIEVDRKTIKVVDVDALLGAAGEREGEG